MGSCNGSRLEGTSTTYLVKCCHLHEIFNPQTGRQTDIMYTSLKFPSLGAPGFTPV